MSRYPRIESRAEFEALDFDFTSWREDEERLSFEEIAEAIDEAVQWEHPDLPEEVEVFLWRRVPLTDRDITTADTAVDSFVEDVEERLAEDGIVDPEEGDLELAVRIARGVRAVLHRELRNHDVWHCEIIAVRHYSQQEIAEILLESDPDDEELRRIAAEDDR